MYAYNVKHNYVLGGMLFTTRKAQLHVSATKFDHHQVVQWKLTNQIYKCMYIWLISFHCTTWWWSKFVAEICSCALRIVNSIPPIHSCVWRYMYTHYSLIYSKLKGDDAPQKSLDTTLLIIYHQQNVSAL